MAVFVAGLGLHLVQLVQLSTPVLAVGQELGLLGLVFGVQGSPFVSRLLQHRVHGPPWSCVFLVLELQLPHQVLRQVERISTLSILGEGSQGGLELGGDCIKQKLVLRALRSTQTAPKGVALESPQQVLLQLCT